MSFDALQFINPVYMSVSDVKQHRCVYFYSSTSRTFLLKCRSKASLRFESENLLDLDLAHGPLTQAHTSKP